MKRLLDTLLYASNHAQLQQQKKTNKILLQLFPGVSRGFARVWYTYTEMEKPEPIIEHGLLLNVWSDAYYEVRAITARAVHDGGKLTPEIVDEIYTEILKHMRQWVT